METIARLHAVKNETNWGNSIPEERTIVRLTDFFSIKMMVCDQYLNRKSVKLSVTSIKNILNIAK